MVGRKPHPMHQQLSLVERTEIGGRRVAEGEHADELVIHRIDDRHRVRELVGRIESVPMADGEIRRGRGSRCLSGKRRNNTAEHHRGGDTRLHYFNTFDDVPTLRSMTCRALEVFSGASRFAHVDCAASARSPAAVRR
jgi:hypothetical protein